MRHKVWFFYPFIFFLVSFVDMVTTCFAIWLDIPEANPLLETIINYSPTLFVIFKLALTFVVILVVESIRPKITTQSYEKIWKGLILFYIFAYLFLFFVANILTLV